MEGPETHRFYPPHAEIFEFYLCLQRASQFLIIQLNKYYATSEIHECDILQNVRIFQISLGNIIIEGKSVTITL